MKLNILVATTLDYVLSAWAGLAESMAREFVTVVGISYVWFMMITFWEN